MSSETNYSSVILGETGVSEKVDSYENLKQLLEKYIKDSGITQNDVSIIMSYNNNNKFIYLNKLEYMPSCNYYMFSKRFNEKLMYNFQEVQNKNTASFATTLNSLNINIPDLTKQFKLIEENKSYLSCSYDDLKLSYDIILTYFNKFNEIYRNFRLHNKLTEQIKEYYLNQSKSLDILNNIALERYDICNKKYIEFLNESDILKKKNDEILQDYTDNIDKIKKRELHPELIKFFNKNKLMNKKYLIDIYFTESDMNIWRDNCLNKQNGFFNKVKTKDAQIQKQKTQINSDTNTFLNQIKNDFKFYINECDKLYAEKSTKINTNFTNIKNDINLLNINICKINEIFESKLINSNPNYSSQIKESCEIILELKIKYSDYTALNNINLDIQTYIDYSNKMKNSIEIISKKINNYFMSTRAIKNVLERLTEKITNYNSHLKAIEEDFKFLESPRFFIKSYENTLREIQRRINFNNDIEIEIQKIKGIITNENFQRNQFIENNKKYLTSDFIKMFKLENKIVINLSLNNNEESELPLIKDYNENNNDKIIIQDSLDINNLDKFKNDDKKLIQNLLNEIKEINANLANKTKELGEYQNKYKLINDNYNILNKDMNKIYEIFDDISDNFNTLINYKEKIINYSKTENENLKSIINQNINNIIPQNCLLCKEKLLNGKDYKQVENLFQEMKEKISEYKNNVNEIDNNYKKLINNVTIIKRCFFNHMNSIIERNNKDKIKFKENYENKIMYMEDLLSNEKIYNQKNIYETLNVLNLKINEYKQSNLKYEEDIKNILKTNNDLKSKELYLKREIQIAQQKNEKLTDNIIELNNEITQKLKDNNSLKLLLEKTKKEHVDSIKILNNTHQSDVDSLNQKLNELSDKLTQKITEDEKQHEEYILIEKDYKNILNEKQNLIEQINIKNNEISEKNKKIEELFNENNNLQLQTRTTKETTTNDFLLPEDEIIYFKKIDKGLRCIFVPFSDGIFVGINLSDNLIEENSYEQDNNPTAYYECKYILDLNSINKDLREIIINNNLIVIGKVGKISEFRAETYNEYDLPDDKKFLLVTLDKIEYVIGFPEDEIMFKIYLD